MRMNLLLVFCMITLLCLSGCDSKEEPVWYETADEAIKKGLEMQHSYELQRLSIDIEILVLYKLNEADAVGVGSVTTSDKGYRWYRGMEPFQANFVQLDYETESKEIIPITIGKTRDKNLKEVTLEGRSNQYELKVVQGYYFGADIELFYDARILDQTHK